MNKTKITKHKDDMGTNYDVEVPKDFRLFRMRANNEHCFSAFLKDEIWGTTPTAFNDPYDTTAIYHKDELYNYAAKMIESDEQVLSVLCDINGVAMSNKAHIKLGRMLVDNMLSSDNIQKNNVISCVCFTERIDSEIMWAHYANNAKGFALEYKYDDIKEFGDEVENVINDYLMSNFDIFDIGYSTKMPSTLVPVLYENFKYDMTDFLKKAIDNELIFVRKKHIYKEEITIRDYIHGILNFAEDFRKDESMFWQMNCLKKKEWKYEHEWRLLSYNTNTIKLISSEHTLIGKLTPIAIYLGEKISNYDKAALISIAKEKGIKIYQMKSKIYKKTMKLGTVEIK